MGKNIMPVNDVEEQAIKFILPDKETDITVLLDAVD